MKMFGNLRKQLKYWSKNDESVTIRQTEGLFRLLTQMLIWVLSESADLHRGWTSSSSLMFLIYSSFLVINIITFSNVKTELMKENRTVYAEAKHQSSFLPFISGPCMEKLKGIFQSGRTDQPLCLSSMKEAAYLPGVSRSSVSMSPAALKPLRAWGSCLRYVWNQKADVSERMTDLPAVEFEPQSQLLVVDDCVLSHVLLGPDAVWQSVLQPGNSRPTGEQRKVKKMRSTANSSCDLPLSRTGTGFSDSLDSAVRAV